jgi:hypothetical protein
MPPDKSVQYAAPILLGFDIGKEMRFLSSATQGGPSGAEKLASQMSPRLVECHICKSFLIALIAPRAVATIV